MTLVNGRETGKLLFVCDVPERWSFLKLVDTGNICIVVNMCAEEISRMSADEMDDERRKQMAYEYLCRLEEVRFSSAHMCTPGQARNWMCECLADQEPLPPTEQLEESMRNGVQLAKLACFFAPTVVVDTKIFDRDERRYTTKGLHFRHTDNILYWRRAAQQCGLPEVQCKFAYVAT
jgi:hypothetical protein